MRNVGGARTTPAILRAAGCSEPDVSVFQDWNRGEFDGGDDFVKKLEERILVNAG